MQVLAFVALMLILFVAGIVFLLRAILQFSKIRKLKNSGKEYKKHIKRGISTLTISMLLIIPPTAFFTVIRVSNGMDDPDYINTGTMIRWDKGQSSFTYDGQKYRKIELKIGNKDTIYWERSEKARMSAKFNIESKPTLLDKIFNGHDREVVWEVQNGTGHVIYDTYCLFAAEKDIHQIEKYYNNLSHYDFYISEENDNGDEILHKFDIPIKEYENLCATAGGNQSRTISAKEDEYDYYEIFALSDDRAISICGPDLYKVNDKWYMESLTKYDDDDFSKLRVIELPDEIAEKLSKTLGENV